jgi:transcriptional regulator with XRE-family HTH domain
VLGRKFCSGCGRWRQVNDFERMPRGLRARCRGCQLAYQRTLYRDRSLEQVERKREYRRFWQDARRRRDGMSARAFRHRVTVIDRAEGIYLELEPLLDAMNAYVARELRNGRDSGNGLPDLWESLALEAGLSARAIWRVRSGESRRVRIDVADKIAVALDIPLSLLYPP